MITLNKSYMSEFLIKIDIRIYIINTHFVETYPITT